MSRIALLFLATLVLGGCAGYRVGNISGRDLQGVRSVYVPTARNTSLSPDLQMTVTNCVIRRFDNDGTLEVNQSSNADSELNITITNVKQTAIASSNNDINITSQYQLTITATVTYTNRRLGKKIFENAEVKGTTTFFTQSNLQEGERQALPLAADDLANNIVKMVTEGW